MSKNILVGLVIDVGNKPNQSSPQINPNSRNIYTQILPTLVLKIMLHHKFHSINGKISMVGNNVYWNHIITSQGNNNKFHNRTNFVEFNKTTYDQFVVNFNKIIISSNSTSVRNLNSKDEPVFKLVMDLIMARFDWNSCVLVSPILLEKRKRKKTDSTNVSQYHYVYYLSLCVDRMVMNTLKSSLIPSIYNSMKRNCLRFSWLPLFFDYSNRDHDVENFLKNLKKLKILLYPISTYLINENLEDDSMGHFQLLLAFLESRHALSFSNINENKANKDTFGIINSYATISLDACIMKEVISRYEGSLTEQMELYSSIPMRNIPNFYKFQKLGKPIFNDTRTRNELLTTDNMKENVPTSTDNNIISLDTQLTDTMVELSTNSINKLTHDDENITILRELENCSKQFYLVKYYANEKLEKIDSKELRDYMENNLLDTIKCFNQRINSEEPPALTKYFYHQLIFRFHILHEYPDADHLQIELIILLRKYALLISPAKMTNFLNDHIIPQFGTSMKDILIKIYDDLMVPKPDVLSNVFLHTSSQSESPYGSTSTPIPKEKFDSKHQPVGLEGEKQYSNQMNNDFNSLVFQNRKNLIVNDSQRHRRMIAIKDKPKNVRRLLFNRTPEHLRIKKYFNIVPTENKPLSNTTNIVECNETRQAKNKEHVNNIESFLTDFDLTQDHFKGMDSNDHDYKSGPRAFYSSKSFTQADSFSLFSTTSQSLPHHKIQSFTTTNNDPLTHPLYSFDGIFSTPQKIKSFKYMYDTTVPMSNNNNSKDQLSAIHSSSEEHDTSNQSSLINISPNNSWVGHSDSNVVHNNVYNITHSPSIKQYYIPSNNLKVDAQCDASNNIEIHAHISPFKYSSYTTGFSTPVDIRKQHYGVFSPLIKSPFKSPLQYQKKVILFSSPSPRKTFIHHNHHSNKPQIETITEESTATDKPSIP